MNSIKPVELEDAKIEVARAFKNQYDVAMRFKNALKEKDIDIIKQLEHITFKPVSKKNSDEFNYNKEELKFHCNGFFRILDFCYGKLDINDRKRLIDILTTPTIEENNDALITALKIQAIKEIKDWISKGEELLKKIKRHYLDKQL